MSIYGVVVIINGVVNKFDTAYTIYEAERIFEKNLDEMGMTDEDYASPRVYKNNNITVQIVAKHDD